MEFGEVVRRRRMVRRFDPDRPVPRTMVEQALYAALRAPSAGYSQGWDFLVLTEQADRDRFWAACVREFGGTVSQGRGRKHAGPDAWLRGVSAAPVLVLCLSDPDTYLDRYAELDKGWTDRDPARWPVPYWDVDTGMAALMMLLSAVDQGLGALFFGVPVASHDAVRRAHGIPGSRRIVGAVALGHELTRVEGSARTRPRRDTREVVHWDHFGGADVGFSGGADVGFRADVGFSGGADHGFSGESGTEPGGR